MQFPHARLYPASLTSLTLKLILLFLLFSLSIVSAFTIVGGVLSRQRWDVLVYQRGWLELPHSRPELLLTDVAHRLEVRLKAFDVYYLSPMWMNDGEHLSVIAFNQESSQLVKISPDAREISPIMQWRVSLDTLEWSPDGTRYAYSTPHPIISNRFELHVAKADGSEERRLTAYNIPFGMRWNFELTRGAFVWSPDSQSLLFTASKNAVNTTSPAHYTDALFQVDVRSGKVWRVADNLLNIAALAVSPDGERVAFTATKGSRFRLYVIDSDGSDLREVSNLSSEAFPVWSWDSREVGYWLKEPKQQTFYALNLETLEQREVYMTEEWAFTPLWRP